MSFKLCLLFLKSMFEFVSKYVWSFFVAMFGGKVNLETYLNRLNKCKDCKWNMEKENNNFCKTCFCPQTKYWKFSELKYKASLKEAKCPMKKWN